MGYLSDMSSAAESCPPSPDLPAWARALSKANTEAEELSEAEVRALDEARERLRAKGADLLTQGEVERVARELEAR